MDLSVVQFSWLSNEWAEEPRDQITPYRPAYAAGFASYIPLDVTNTVMSEFISIGAQTGGPEAELLGQLKVPLFQSLRECVTSTHCSAIDEYALVLRVDGTLDKFGPEGLARLRFAKARRYITLDIQVPESVWHPFARQQAKAYLVRQVWVALEACVDRLTKDGHSVNNQLLWEEVNVACTRYLAANDDA